MRRGNGNYNTPLKRGLGNDFNFKQLRYLLNDKKVFNLKGPRFSFICNRGYMVFFSLKKKKGGGGETEKTEKRRVL